MLSIRKIVLTFAATAAVSAFATEPDGYYSSCENKGGAALLTALRAKVGPHTTVSYDGLWDLYTRSDVKPNGKLWDMYSTKEWTPGKEKCGNYKLVGDCVNREHSFPKSWFNDAKPMYSDAFHLYPTDGKVNGQRSNYPFGECANGTTLPANGSVRALGRLGTSTFPGYTGRVLNPTMNTRATLLVRTSIWLRHITTRLPDGARICLPATRIPLSNRGPSTCCLSGTVRTP